MDLVLFLTFALIAVACALNMALQRHPVSSALSLVGVMVSLAVLYVLLGAEFIAAAQLVVYSGAIMVLFIFVIMLLNAGAEKLTKKAGTAQFPLLVILLAFSAWVITNATSAMKPVKFGAFTGGGPREVGWELFTRYLLPFEVTSILILIAIAGAYRLANKEME